MSDLFEMMKEINRVNFVKTHAQEIAEIRDELAEALRLAMRQLDDPDEDINAVRQQAEKALRRAELRI